MMELRSLTFHSLDDISAELDRLQRSGYQSKGAWGLAATCEHLSDWMSFPMDGFPKMLAPVRCMLAILRTLQGKRLFRKILATKQMKLGTPTLPSTIHPEAKSDAASVDRYRRCIERLKEFRGPIHPSPLFGAMTYDELVSIQLIHAAHHLRFLEPKED